MIELAFATSSFFLIILNDPFAFEFRILFQAFDEMKSFEDWDVGAKFIPSMSTQQIIALGRGVLIM